MKYSLKLCLSKHFVVVALLLMSTVASARNLPSVQLSNDEKASLIYMREEEKLARDVYRELSSTWGSPIFENIANSEQTHMDAIKTLLVRYGIDDPAATTKPGDFSNPHLQELYYELTTQGMMSLTDALTVGVIIEETDIVDLQYGIGIVLSTHKDIIKVYNNLLNGSLNHLDAFENNLEPQ